MKKIGILTYFWAENSGTFLQAYATQEAFRKRLAGHRVELVDYKHRRAGFKLSRNHLHPVRFYKYFIKYRLYRQARERHLVLSPESLISTNYEKTLSFVKRLGYDMLVAGADTILQLLDHHRRDGTVPIYWLPPELGGIRVMCGSSCRALTITDLTDSQRAIMKRSINAMPLIGVRDDATYEMIRLLGLDDESKLERIPDPTFSLKIDASYAERFVQRKRLDFSCPSVLIALPDSYLLGPELARCYQSRGYRVFSFGNASYADVELPDVSPFEWAGLYKYFDLVLTDRFHGSLFSLLNGTPAVTIVCRREAMTSRGQSKYASLWELFGLERTNWINGTECTEIDAVVDKIDKGAEAFRVAPLQEKLNVLKNEYLDFVSRVASLLK